MNRRLGNLSALWLNLFPDTAFGAERTRLELRHGGDFIWVGRIVGEPLSEVVFASHAGAITARIDRPLENGNAVYTVGVSPDGETYVAQADPIPPGNVVCDVTIPDPGEPIPPGPPAADPIPATPEDPAVIDVMVVYTPAAAAAMGGNAAIESQILLYIASANTGYQNSQVHITLQLAHMAEVNYAESGSMGTTLEHVTTAGDGFMDEVHAWRDQYSADLVCVLTQDSDACGRAYLMSVVDAGFEPFAFSVVRRACLSNLSLTHELAHNMGCQHDRSNALEPPAYPYSYGYSRCIADGLGFRTVMAYPCATVGVPRVNHFSNPAISFNGFPTGIDHALDPSNSADNARSINQTARVVAAFRVSPDLLPTPPSGLTATVAGPGSVSLSWIDNATDETLHQVERSTDDLAWTQIASVGADFVGYADAGLAEGTTYSYRVRACNSDGCSAWSNVASATTPVIPPAAPTGLAATAGSNAVNLSWTDTSANEAGFQIDRSPDAVAWVQVAALGPNIASYSDSGLTAGQAYYYQVRAWNVGGSSPPSNIAGAVAPTGASSTVTYTSVGAEDGYVTESSETSNLGGTAVGTASSSTALRAGDTFEDRQIRAILSFDTAPIPDAATVVSANLRLKRGGVNGTSPFLTHGTCWVDIKGGGFGGATDLAAEDFHASAHASRVAGLSSAAADGSWSEGALDATGLVWVNKTGRTQFRASFNQDDNDDLGTDYIGWYSGENSVSANRPQLIVTSSTETPFPPVAPVQLIATPASPNQIDLAWQDTSANEYGFLLERSPDGVVWTPIASLPADSSSHADPGLASDSTRSYRVRAFNAAGNSPWSNLATATTPPGPPAAPSDLAAIAVSESRIELTWTDNASDEAGFALERSTDEVTWLEIVRLPANSTAQVDAALLAGTTYYYRVYAFRDAGDSPYSNTATASTWIPNSAPVAGNDSFAASEDVVLSIAPPGVLANDTDADGDLLILVSHSQPLHGVLGMTPEGGFTYAPAANYNGPDSFTYAVVDGQDFAEGTVDLLVQSVNDVPTAASDSYTAVQNSVLTIAAPGVLANDTDVDGDSLTVTGHTPAALGAVIVGLDGAFTYTPPPDFHGTDSFAYTVSDGHGGTATATLALTITPAGDVPAAPGALTANAISSSRIDLAWSDNAADEDGFRIERSFDGGAIWTELAVVAANLVGFNDTCLSGNTTCSYRVRAYNLVGNSPWSNTASATTPPPVTVAVTFVSGGVEDGCILESGETTSIGGTAWPAYNNAAALRAGDDLQDRQYRTIVSFDTSSIPDGATILSARLLLRRGTVLGTNPFQTHGTCWVDIKTGSFNGAAALTADDFQAAADATRIASLGNAAANGDWSEGDLGAAGLARIDTAGTTQFRVYFSLDDNDDLGTDYIGWYSGENATPDNRPQLVVQYQ